MTRAGGIGNRMAEIALVTQLAAAAGVLAAVSMMYLMRRTIDIGMAGNGAIAGLVAITAPSGYVEFWAAPIIGAVGGIIVVVGVLAIEKVLDDPVGALSAHGLAGIWGTLSCGLFTAPRFAEFNAVGDAGLWYTGSFSQLGAQALGIAAAFGCVFVVSIAVFAADQVDHRPARLGRAGGDGPRPRRARHVRIPGAVHPAAGVLARSAGPRGGSTDSEARARNPDDSRHHVRRLGGGE